MRSGEIIRGGGTCQLVDTAGMSRSSIAEDSLPRFYPSLSPSYQVKLGLGAQRAIEREISSARRDFGPGVESGGWLLADRRWPDNIIVATDPGDDARFSRRSVLLDFDRLEELERAFPHLALRGDWHTHPSGDHIPSRTDRRAWMRGRELIRGFYVGIVATPPSGMYRDPELHGWLTTESFCEPLRLELP